MHKRFFTYSEQLTLGTHPLNYPQPRGQLLVVQDIYPILVVETFR